MTKNEFYKVAEDWISHPKENWNHLTLMAYFYHKYKKRSGVNFYPASWSGNPALTKESRDFAKLFKIWAPEDYALLDSDKKRGARSIVNQKAYNYINWMFDYKFRYGNKAVTGTGIFLNNNMLNEFEVMYMNRRVSYFKDYSEQKPSKNPPFSSIYLCSKMLPKQCVFEEVNNRAITLP